MNELTTLRTPKRVLARIQVGRLGKILFNLQFIALALLFASVISVAATLVFYLFMLIITLATVGLIYVAYPEVGNWWAGGEKLQNIFVALAGCWKYVIPVSIVLAISSIICLCFDYREKHKGKIIVSAVFGVIAVAVLIIKLVGGA